MAVVADRVRAGEAWCGPWRCSPDARGDNLCVDTDGQRVAEYVPAHIRRYPFVLGETGEQGRFVVMIDRAAPNFVDAEGEDTQALFVDGAPPKAGSWKGHGLSC
ncbi:MAG: SapC family protein [Arhodomonas sp.]|nr:SapC family protein [Arhodomonas sp.]